MSSTYAMIHAAHYLINEQHNPEPTGPLVTLVHTHKETLTYTVDIFEKTTSPAVSLRVPVRGAY